MQTTSVPDTSFTLPDTSVVPADGSPTLAMRASSFSCPYVVVRRETVRDVEVGALSTVSAVGAEVEPTSEVTPANSAVMV
jgi:hypothetical protein